MAGGLLAAVIVLVATLAAGWIFWVRAAAILELGDSPPPVIPIVSILLRTAGDAYAALGIGVGAAGGVFALVAKRNPSDLLQSFAGLLPLPSVETSSRGGVAFLLWLGVASFFTLLLFYFLAESSVVAARVAAGVWLLVKRERANPSGAMPKPTFPASRDRAVP
jgi:hypothetical protein